MLEPIYTETINWKGTQHYLELYATNVEPDFLISQCQTVPFTPSGDIVLFKHINGCNSLPGGTVEMGEGLEAALRREVYEESACTINRFGLIGYIKDTNSDTSEVKYQLRYWADVELLDEPVNDPDGKALERIIVSAEELPAVLGWGGKGDVLLQLAQKARAAA
jgi:ADP-ribose pyrophosphatase YjhB (NUDIX family)